MHVRVVASNEVVFDHEIEKESFVLGRGSKCDIRCLNKHLSRKHLEIKNENGQIFIKNVSSSNWVALNQQKIEPGEYVPYFNFSKLELPGEIEIFLDFKENVEEESWEDESKPLDNVFYPHHSYDPRDAKRAVPRATKAFRGGKKKKDKVNPELLKMAVFLFVLAGGYFFYFQKEEQPAPLPSGSEPALTQNKSSSQKKQKPAEKLRAKTSSNASALVRRPLASEEKKSFKSVSSNFDPLAKKNCSTAAERVFCKKFINKLSKHEGFVIKDSILFGFLSFKERRARLMKEGKLSALSKKSLQQYLIANYFLDKAFVEEAKEQKLEKAYIYLLDDDPLVPSAEAIFMVDTAKERRYQNQALQAALNAASKHGNLYFIDNFFGFYMARIK